MIAFHRELRETGCLDQNLPSHSDGVCNVSACKGGNGEVGEDRSGLVTVLALDLFAYIYFLVGGSYKERKEIVKRSLLGGVRYYVVLLYNFFNTMMEQFSFNGDKHNSIMKAFEMSQQRSLTFSSGPLEQYRDEDDTLRTMADPNKFRVESTYMGPKLQFPLTREQIKDLVAAFKERKVLHIKYLLELLHHARRHLMTLPNINRVSTSLSGQVTVCGDLHGKLDDLYVIFQKNGMPAVDNPYIFNGDFVDRGSHSVEVICLLLACCLESPKEVFLNRGNHEDHTMNIRYGFTKEIMRKYKENAVKVIRLFDDVFSWLPLASIVDDKVLIVHGGVSDQVDLDFIETIDRHKYVSILRPPAIIALEQSIEANMDLRELEEWKQILDIMWSDPRQVKGTIPNTFRGGGCYFGPDVTSRVLNNHKLKLLIRSHECKEEGYEYTHNDKLLTIFSASNYYDDNSNKGAYVKVMGDNQYVKSPIDGKPVCHIVQFVAKTRGGRRLTFTERISHLESSALRNVRDLIIANRSDLEVEFQKYDPENTGMIPATQWCQAMEMVMDIDVPWRLLRMRLVSSAVNSGGQQVLWESTFHDRRVSFKNLEAGGPSITESLYRHKDILETIFRTFDKDNSGHISMSEFAEACGILVRHTNLNLHNSQIEDIARSLDLNKDGQIDFNEFLEAFRIVDNQEKRGRAEMLFDILEKDSAAVRDEEMSEKSIDLDLEADIDEQKLKPEDNGER